MNSAFEQRFRATRYQSGMTLIELLVALALGLLVTVIAATALLIGQQGYRAVDSTTSLRDRQRFAVELITRLVVQAGFQDFGAAQVSLRANEALATGIDPEPDIFGWNNSVYANPGTLALSESGSITSGSRPGACTVSDSSCKNGSDILVIRFQGISASPTSTASDNTMINCSGQGESGLPTGALNDRSISIFHVSRAASGEPSLSCSYYSFGSGVWVNTPILEGVESFQVLYGTDGVNAGVATPAGANQDYVPDRWLRADQLTVPGSLVATRDNWRRVRAVRIGLLMRGSAGAAQQSVAATYQPLGSLYVPATADSADPGPSLTVAADGRVRQQTAFTVHLRNDMMLR